jgi:hypothetical protein
VRKLIFVGLKAAELGALVGLIWFSRWFGTNHLCRWESTIGCGEVYQATALSFLTLITALICAVGIGLLLWGLWVANWKWAGKLTQKKYKEW